MSPNISISLKANDWFAKGLTLKQVEEELLQSGTEPRHVPELMAEIKKLYNARKTSRGLVLILIGAVLCLLSCVLTLMSFGDISLVLYGMTTIGLIVVFAGLVQIFS
ncbi:MAG: hypothetical protein K0R82_2889 [Flavipsychrobacter sp.]|jgi:hypothetical protein|nr:hypothetical protein [Flavipsychrobacter sp.]